MKFTKKLLFLLFGIMLLGSCETDNVQETPLNNSSDLKTTINVPAPESDPYTLENYSQWAAFTASYMLRYDRKAQAIFQNTLSVKKTITFEDIFSNNISVGNYSFTTQFKEQLFLYLNCCPDPDTETHKPPPPGTPPFAGGDTDPEILLEQMMIYLLQDNCMEFYFPNGINLSGHYSITSTAHPLNTTLENAGITRIYDPIVNEDYPNGISTFPEVVNDEFAGQGDLIILVRPVRSIWTSDPDDPCLYPEYEDIDFTDFLD